MHCSCLLQIQAECLLQSDWWKIEVLQINIFKKPHSGVGFEGLYPRPKLVATDPNSWGENQTMPQMYFLLGFFVFVS